MDQTKPPIILIIDDDPSLRDSLRRTLRSHRYAVMEAAEGSEGITIAQSHSIDVVLVDLFMPGKEGLETIMELRLTYLTDRIIAMSGGGARGQVDVLQAATMMGCCRTLIKPFSRETLLEAVEHVLRSRTGDVQV